MNYTATRLIVLEDTAILLFDDIIEEADLTVPNSIDIGYVAVEGADYIVLNGKFFMYIDEGIAESLGNVSSIQMAIILNDYFASRPFITIALTKGKIPEIMDTIIQSK